MSPEEAALEAKKIGIDGICFAEHNKPWNQNEILTIQEKYGILVFHGIEVDSSEGHVLVFGLNKEFRGITPIEDLHKTVDEAGGFMIAAHPFRGFLVFGLSELKMDIDNACDNPLFKFADGIEILSGRQTPKENDFSSQVCERLGLKGVGGSDAHVTKDIGKCVTVFENSIKEQEDLIKELKAGRFKADYFRKS